MRMRFTFSLALPPKSQVCLRLMPFIFRIVLFYQTDNNVPKNQGTILHLSIYDNPSFWSDRIQYIKVNHISSWRAFLFILLVVVYGIVVYSIDNPSQLPTNSKKFDSAQRGTHILPPNISIYIDCFRTDQSSPFWLLVLLIQSYLAFLPVSLKGQKVAEAKHGWERFQQWKMVSKGQDRPRNWWNERHRVNYISDICTFFIVCVISKLKSIS